MCTATSTNHKRHGLHIQGFGQHIVEETQNSKTPGVAHDFSVIGAFANLIIVKAMHNSIISSLCANLTLHIKGFS